jgi:Bifunctional DNA primase/polymerase, N-terminal
LPNVPVIVARDLVRKGFAVFPVWDKRPLTPHGVHSAARTLLEFGRLNWRDANGVGVATGEVSGVDVLDVDIRGPQGARGNPPSIVSDGDDVAVDGLATLASLGALPETRAASTPNGGRHYWFKHIEGSRNRTLAPGLEWFSDGKLVVVPPAPGREWISEAEAEIAEAPEWLRAMVLSPRHKDHKSGRDFSGPLVAPQNSGSGSRVPKPIYSLILRGMPTARGQSQRRVRGLWACLAAKRDHRNDGLNYTAWQFSEFVRSGNLDAKIASDLLRLACEANGYLAKDGEEVVEEIIERVVKPNQERTDQ